MKGGRGGSLPPEEGGPPSDVSAALEAAQRRGEDGDWDGMATLLRETLDDHPSDPFVLCWLGVAERELGLDGVAYERFKACLAAGPQDAQLLATAGGGLAAFDDPEAEGALRTASMLAPDLAFARWMYGAYLSREGLLDDALRELQAARELDPDEPIISYELGVALTLAGNRDGAVDELYRAVELDPDDGWTRVVLGLTLLEEDRPEEALTELAVGARLRPDDAEAQLLASLAAAGQDDDLAWEMLERARLTEADEALVEAVEERLDEDAESASAFLRGEVAPSALRDRLAQRPLTHLIRRLEPVMDVSIPHERITLANGLDVLVHEDHSAPVVGVNVWYHVGSKDERPGRTGLAHLFEHLMFEGSANVPTGQFDRYLESAGGVNNGSTTTDRTNYWANVPSSALELVFWLESDRMGFLLDALSQEKLDLQRDVVKNERRQSYENRPYGLAFETMLAALYPKGHPYHHPVIGSMHDVSEATLDDAAAFFRAFYAPGNASLAVAGDVSTKEVFALAERYFGDISAAPRPPETSAEVPSLPAERRIVLEDRVHLPRLYMAWHSARHYTHEDAVLELLAGVLAGGKTSRLYKRLVYDERIAQDVSVFQNGCELSGSFFVVVTAKPGVRLPALEERVRSELARVVQEGVRDEELARTLSQIESEMVRALERSGGFGGKADRLNEYLTFTGDASFVTQDLGRYQSVTLETLVEVARRRLIDQPATLLSVVPHEWPDLAAGESA